MLFSIFLLLGSLGSERVYHEAPVTLTDTVITLPAGDTGGLLTYSSEARVALDNIKECEGMSPGRWTLFIAGESGDTLAMTLRHGNTAYGDILDRRFTRLTVRRGGKVLFDDEVDGFSSSPGAFNTLSAELSESGLLMVRGGGKKREIVAQLQIDTPFSPTESGVAVAGGSGEVSLFCCEESRLPEAVVTTGWSHEELTEYIKASDDPAEGFWKYLDRENDPEYARPGGRYLLATVRNKDAGGYDIIYVDGARTYSDRWNPMMLKGRLIPTIFTSHYDLEWLDSSFEPMTEDLHADITDGAILTLSFPMFKTVMRFSKMPVR